MLLIWPEGVVYGGVTPERMERIVREHVIGGRNQLGNGLCSAINSRKTLTTLSPDDPTPGRDSP